MESKKIKIFNIIFLVIIIIYEISNVTIFSNMYLTNKILVVGSTLYIVGFIIFAICNMINKKENIGLKICLGLTILSMMITIIQNVVALYVNWINDYYPTGFEIIVIIMGFLRINMLCTFLYYLYKKDIKKIHTYLLIIVSVIFFISKMVQQIEFISIYGIEYIIEEILWYITGIYMTIYLVLLSKNEK